MPSKSSSRSKTPMRQSTTPLTSLSPSGCAIGNGTLFISLTLGIILNLIFISSLNNLEKLSNCDCASMPERRYLKEFFVFVIFFQLVMIILFAVSNFDCWEHFYNYPIIFASYVIVGLLNLIMLIRLFIYVRLLKNNCKCAYGNMEKFIYWYFVIVFSLIAAVVVLSIFLAIMAAIKLS